MTLAQPTLAVPATMIQQALGKPLNPGEMGVLLARAGVGKTACLTHIALGYLLNEQTVLHVCIDELPEKIKVWYQELLRNLGHTTDQSFPSHDLRQQVETSRFIMSFLHHTFNPGKLEQSLINLSEQVEFRPSLVVLDGLDFERSSRSQLEHLARIADKYGLSFWMSCRTHRHIDTINDRGIPYPCHELDDLFQAIVVLDPQPEDIRLTVLKHYDRYAPEYPSLLLNPQTFLLKQQE